MLKKLFKNLAVLLMLCLYLSYIPIGKAMKISVQQAANPNTTMLTYDKVLYKGALRNYRNAKDCLQNTAAFNGINIAGLAALKISGSAQFSKKELPFIVARATGVLYIVDLRQEPHGFINDHAFTLFSYRNQINAKKTAAVISAEETKLFEQLRSNNTAVLHKIKKIADGDFESVANKNLTVNHVLSEQQLLQQFKINYQRFYILDHHKPSDTQVDAFLNFIKELPKDAWLHFHCRAGKGRTTTFMTMYDIIYNAKYVSLENILARQAALGGTRLYAAKTKANSMWADPAVADRYQFIAKFYQYVLDPQGYMVNSWQKWLLKNS